jgi:hypothetical protein
VIFLKEWRKKRADERSLVSDDEIIIDAEMGQELVPTGGAPATLFRTDEPGEIVFRATQVATALSSVLKKQGLTKRISGKDYVQVEGWTLCGSMLGVFPVVEWTRPVEGGWEARVEARTRDGATVGAAEAECLRSEKRWKDADDYAVRSMAQTRAISKALRAPLGFIVALAGYEATPEEEMPGERTEPSPFDPDRDLLPGAIAGEGYATRLRDALRGIDPSVVWQAVIDSAIEAKWGKPDLRHLGEGEKADFWRRLSNAVQWIDDHTPAGDFPPVETTTIMDGFEFAFGVRVTVVYTAPEKPEEGAPLTKDEARQAEEAITAGDDAEWPEEGRR